MLPKFEIALWCVRATHKHTRKRSIAIHFDKIRMPLIDGFFRVQEALYFGFDGAATGHSYIDAFGSPAHTIGLDKVTKLAIIFALVLHIGNVCL